MKNLKKLIATLTMVTMVGAAGFVYAAEIKTPADIASQVTGKSLTDVQKERAAGKTYGTIAKDAGKLDAFKVESLAQKKATLDQQVKDGKITQAKADEIYNAIKNNQATCDATGTAKIGKNNGVSFGQGQGMGMGKGQGLGQGRNQGKGRGMGQGMGCGAGTCTVTTTSPTK